MCCNKDSLKTIKYSSSAQIGDEKGLQDPQSREKIQEKKIKDILYDILFKLVSI